ncbi:hypothetical protein T492DRAFT_988622 [Pavlovales sp. CCMP2436]|nr:hypothetical protein T492DRAFT_988622 [Pavlovales sp. CCMP2436]
MLRSSITCRARRAPTRELHPPLRPRHSPHSHKSRLTRAGWTWSGSRASACSRPSSTHASLPSAPSARRSTTTARATGTAGSCRPPRYSSTGCRPPACTSARACGSASGERSSRRSSSRHSRRSSASAHSSRGWSRAGGTRARVRPRRTWPRTAARRARSSASARAR